MDTEDSPFGEVKALLHSQGEALDGFKAAQTKRMDEIEAKLNRLGLSSGPRHGGSSTAEAKAMAAFVRRGDESEIKAMSVGSDPDGGYLVSPALSDGMVRKAFDVSPIGRLARRVTIGAGDAFEEPIDVDEIGASWVGEASGRPATDSAKLKALRVPVHEIYALQKVTQRLLDDARFDVGQWVVDKINDKFARAAGSAFVKGDGVLKPRGLLSYPTANTADETRDWFTIQHVNTGHASTFIAATTSASPADCLVDMVYALRAPYRAEARWTMNRKTAAVVRKLKDSEGRFIWADAREGQPATLLGFPVEMDEEMPDIGAGTLPIAFGDFRQAYVIVEKPGIRMLRDNLTDKPHVLTYAYARFGGGLQNGEAVKLLRVAASG